MAVSEMNYIDITTGEIEVGVERLVGTFKVSGVVYNRYVKVVDYGVLPNATNKSVPHNISGITSCEQFIGFKMTVRNSTEAYNMSDIPTTSSPWRLFVTPSNIIIQVTGNWSAYNGLATLEYYK